MCVQENQHLKPQIIAWKNNSKINLSRGLFSSELASTNQSFTLPENSHMKIGEFKRSFLLSSDDSNDVVDIGFLEEFLQRLSQKWLLAEVVHQNDFPKQIFRGTIYDRVYGAEQSRIVLKSYLVHSFLLSNAFFTKY